MVNIVGRHKKQNIKTHTGVVHTSDAFNSPKLENDIQLAQTAGILAFEMEAAAILMLGALYKIRAGCIFSIDGFVKNISDGDVKPDSNACNRGIESAIESSLEAMLILS